MSNVHRGGRSRRACNISRHHVSQLETLEERLALSTVSQATEMNLLAPQAAPQQALTVVDDVVLTIATQIVTNADVIPRFATSPTNTTVRSGNWNDAAIWSAGRVPTNGDRVLISPGTLVNYSIQSDASLYSLEVGGQLSFATQTNTRLKVGTITVMPDGTLQVGTTASPVASNVRAEIIIANQTLDTGTANNPGFDPRQFGTGLIALGTVSIHGAPINNTWVQLSSEPKAGSISLELSETISGWLPGAKIELPDTRQLAPDDTTAPQWEEATIAAVSGNRIILTAPLKYNHLGARDAAGSLALLPHVALLDRNVVIRSENPQGTRGHVYFTARADVDVEYARFQDLGRTTAFTDVDDTTFDALGAVSHIGTNQADRYAVQFAHLLGPKTSDSPYQFKFIGNTIDGALKWAVGVHDSNLGLLQGNVVNGAQGAGFGTEDGTEIGNQFLDNFTMRIQGTNVAAGLTVINPLGIASEIRPSADTDRARGDALRSAVDNARDGDTIVLGPGTFDLGFVGNLYLGGANGMKRLTIKGAGQDQTHILNAFANRATEGACFECGIYTVIEDVWLESNCNIDYQATVVGYGASSETQGNHNSPDDATTILRNCRITGRAWSVYVWGTGRGDSMQLYNCLIEGGKWLVNAGKSTGTNASFIDLYDCRLVGDANRSTYEGEVGDRLFGLAARGGRIRAYNSSIQLIGNASTDLVSGAWTDDTGSTDSLIELYNTSIRTISNGAKATYDLDRTIGKIKVAGGSGSGTAGTYRTHGSITWTSTISSAPNPSDPGPNSRNYGNEGSGFWFRRGGNVVMGNVAADSSYAGFVFDGSDATDPLVLANFGGADPRLLSQSHLAETNPAAPFANNETYGRAEYGISLAYVLGDDLVDNATMQLSNNRIWHVSQAGIHANHTSNLAFDGLIILFDPAAQDLGRSGAYGMQLDESENRYLTVNGAHIEGAQIGIAAPRNDASQPGSERPTLIQDSRLTNFINVLVQPAEDKVPSNGNSLLLRGVFLRLLSWLPGGPQAVPSFDPPANIQMKLTLEDSDLTKPSIVRVLDHNQDPATNFQVFYREQLPTYIVPQTAQSLYGGDAKGTIGSPLSGLTNLENLVLYRLAIAGGIAPAGFTTASSMNGLLAPIQSTNTQPRISLATPSSNVWVAPGQSVQVRASVYGVLPYGAQLYYVVDRGLPTTNVSSLMLSAGTHSLRIFAGDSQGKPLPGIAQLLRTFTVLTSTSHAPNALAAASALSLAPAIVPAPVNQVVANVALASSANAGPIVSPAAASSNTSPAVPTVVSLQTPVSLQTQSVVAQSPARASFPLLEALDSVADTTDDDLLDVLAADTTAAK